MMSVVEMTWNPTSRQLRQFALISLIALPLLAWIWSNGDASTTMTTGVIGVFVLLVGYFQPTWLKPLFLGLCLVTMPIGIVVGELCLVIIYYGLFVPIAFVFRLIGRDALSLRLDRDATSYWEKKKRPSGPASYFRQW